MDAYAADFTGLLQSFKLRRINPNVLLPLPNLTTAGLEAKIAFIKKERAVRP
jgi:hypothetical protein